MDKFVNNIKRKYRERLLQRIKQWPPVRGDRLIKLQLVEADKTEGFRAGLPQHHAPNDKVKRTPILHGDLFEVEEDKQPVKKVIVEGNAGIGKTTLCTMLTEEWANGEILAQFDCVLLLPLRERSVSTATTVRQLFKLLHSSERIRTSVIEELEDREGEGVLIIADGWDELDSESRSDNSFLHNLLFGNTLPFVSVLLTSRLSASASLHNLPTVDRLVEVVGFNEENVKQYIESEFEKCPEKASSLIEQLENNPLIASVCSVPLNCAIVCNVWRTFESGLPATLTELYAHIVLNVIFRNIRKANPGTSPIGLETFDDIPTANQEMFWLTCAFAYNCLREDKLVFTESKVASIFPQVLDSSDRFLCLGLLQYSRSLLPVGQGLSFHFVHLTIQEFLAALHLVTLPNEEKLKVWKAHAESVQFAMVWRFVFGLGCQKEGSYSRKVICFDDEVVDRFLVTRYDIFSHVQLMLCHCALESLSNTVCQKLAKPINWKFKLEYSICITPSTPHNCSSPVNSPYDYVAVFCVLGHTSHCLDIRMNLSNCGLTDKLLKELADILCSKGDELQVRELSLCGNKMTDDGINDLFSRASASFSCLQHLVLDSNRITSVEVLCSHFDSLVSLSLSNNPLGVSPLGVSGIQSLETAVQAGVLGRLCSLYLSNTLTDDADINGALLTTLLPSIASHCPRLNYFDLSNNNLGNPSANALGTFLHSFSGVNSTIDLTKTNINSEAIKSLVQFSVSSKILAVDVTLVFNDNSLGCDGLLTLLKVQGPFQIDAEKIGIALTQPEPQLPEAISLMSDSNSIAVLSLSCNNFSGYNIAVLAKCFTLCQALEIVYTRDCSLGSADIISLFSIIQSSGSTCKVLKIWDLTLNSIDEEGIAALDTNLDTVFPCLNQIELLDNPASADSIRDLTSKLDKRPKSIINNRTEILNEFERQLNDPKSINLLYFKVFFIGPSGVGKTTFCNRFCKIFTNLMSISPEKREKCSTNLVECTQVLALVSDSLEELKVAHDLDEELQHLFEFLSDEAVHTTKSNQPPSVDKPVVDSLPDHSQINESVSLPAYQSKPNPRGKMDIEDDDDEEDDDKEVSSEREMDETVRQAASNQLHSDVNVRDDSSLGGSRDTTLAQTSPDRSSALQYALSKLRNIVRVGNYGKMFFEGKYLLSLNDMGGQPGFLELLPFLSRGPGIFFVFFPLHKRLSELHEVTYERKGISIEPYQDHCSFKEALSQILSAISHHSSCKFKWLNTKEMTDLSKIKPVATLIGTFKDQLEKHLEMATTPDSTEEDLLTKELERKNLALEETTSSPEFDKIIIGNSKQNMKFFAVDNYKGDEDIVDIHRHLAKVLKNHFIEAKVKVRPAQVLFSLLLRKMFNIISLKDCYRIGQELRMKPSTIEFTLLYFHHFVGTLFYFPEISPWFQNNIICSPQVIFESISTLIVDSLISLPSTCNFEREKKIWTQRGLFSQQTIEQLTKSHRKMQEDKFIPVEELIKLLQHVNLLAPVKVEGDDLLIMPAILKGAPYDSLRQERQSSLDPLLVTFKCGFVPLGLFCGMVSHLITQGVTPNGILGVKWELCTGSGVNVCRNLATFKIDETKDFRVTLIAFEHCYEIRMYVSTERGVSNKCKIVLSTILFVLSELNREAFPIIGFYCKCGRHEEKTERPAICSLYQRKTTPSLFECSEGEVKLTESQEIWFTKVFFFKH